VTHDPSDVRDVLDAAIRISLPVSGGTVRKRLKQLRRALADVDEARARYDRLAAESTEEA
jgi:hypothetical protein